MIQKIETAIRIFRLFKNWPVIITNYIAAPEKSTKTKFNLRNGVAYETPSKEDWTTITEIWSCEIYTTSDDELQDNYTILDIGAHVGIFSIYAAKQSPNVQVYAYEPNLENFSLLERNIKLNHLKNVKAYKIAVGKTCGRRMLFTSSNDRGHSFFSEISKSQNCGEVRCITLRQILDQVGRCDFLKMDCEGAEYEILLNTPKHYIQKIRKIIVECHDIGSSENNKNVITRNPYGLKAYLEEASFKVALMKSRYTGDSIYLKAKNMSSF